MTIRIALATCADFPQLDDDDGLLPPAFAAAGATAVPTVWDDASIRWSDFDAVVLRSTWDYPDHAAAFTSWLTQVEDTTRLINPARLVHWNMDKGYLGVLASGGLPTVPTSFVQPGGYLRLPTEGEFVLKPTVSAGSRDTARYDARSDGMQAVGHAQRLLEAGRTVMVQPYVHSVDTAGETALLFMGGSFSHAVRKGPLLALGAQPTEELFAAEVIEPRIATSAQQELARAVLQAVPTSLGTPTYARVDLLDTPSGPIVLELELIEPSLFLNHGHGAAERLVAAVLGMIERT